MQEGAVQKGVVVPRALPPSPTAFLLAPRDIPPPHIGSGSRKRQWESGMRGGRAGGEGNGRRGGRRVCAPPNLPDVHCDTGVWHTVERLCAKGLARLRGPVGAQRAAGGQTASEGRQSAGPGAPAVP